MTQTKGESVRPTYVYVLKSIRKTQDTIVTIKVFFRIISGSKVKVLKGYKSVASFMNTVHETMDDLIWSLVGLDVA